MEALGVTQAHLLGVSYSAAVALGVAVLAPNLAGSLTLIEPPPRHGRPAAEFVAVNERLQRLFSDEGVATALEAFTREMGGTSLLAQRAHSSPEFVLRVERDAKTFFCDGLAGAVDMGVRPRAREVCHLSRAVRRGAKPATPGSSMSHGG